uniref:Glycosyltransferase subfamily 4-like N-terminal domain-containing protein n=1 Tax=Chromera velia CCMP2878 TaxID=1169474 RepID=A0A0G4IES7_9ALVE|eukprot:Cvel_2426.t1-p1 / transcript=Cvel_2426.t1 / gene=Cvel_2426 / organism=Chromera_velia_CCMP2878 / gene_product=Chitobiosyldiphosphodolichol, putative / transcript_product=Chitobiosyldiphosphodolichol, putative / location=Cvel_scaffold95:6794-18307(+) / protein_length=1043 / sequence_SO=supercontig / SO=protein_coding / is_pseudo=false
MLVDTSTGSFGIVDFESLKIASSGKLSVAVIPSKLTYSYACVDLRMRSLARRDGRLNACWKRSPAAALKHGDALKAGIVPLLFTVLCLLGGDAGPHPEEKDLQEGTKPIIERLERSGDQKEALESLERLADHWDLQIPHFLREFEGPEVYDKFDLFLTRSLSARLDSEDLPSLDTVVRVLQKAVAKVEAVERGMQEELLAEVRERKRGSAARQGLEKEKEKPPGEDGTSQPVPPESDFQVEQTRKSLQEPEPSTESPLAAPERPGQTLKRPQGQGKERSYRRRGTKTKTLPAKGLRSSSSSPRTLQFGLPLKVTKRKGLRREKQAQGRPRRLGKEEKGSLRPLNSADSTQDGSQLSSSSASTNDSRRSSLEPSNSLRGRGGLGLWLLVASSQGTRRQAVELQGAAAESREVSLLVASGKRGDLKETADEAATEDYLFVYASSACEWVFMFIIHALRRLPQTPVSSSSPGDAKRKRVAVVVLGDIGRSPRMQNHAHSIATCKELNSDVCLVGYDSSKPHARIRTNPNITVCPLLPPLVDPYRKLFPTKLGFLVFAFLKLFEQTAGLFLVLALMPRLTAIVVQNPPSIPTLLVVNLAALVKRAKVVIDFHNYGFTILQLGVGKGTIVRLAEAFEKLFGRRCDASFCVSDAMRSDLKEAWGVERPEAVVLYDKPSEVFRPCSLLETHEVLFRCGLRPSLNSPLPLSEGTRPKNVDVLSLEGGPSQVTEMVKKKETALSKDHTSSNSSQRAVRETFVLPEGSAVRPVGRMREEEQVAEVTVCTRLVHVRDEGTGTYGHSCVERLAESGGGKGRTDVPVLLMSSTSWTADEDFDLFWEVLKIFSAERERRKKENENEGSDKGQGGRGGPLPSLIVLITGKGPMQKAFIDRAKETPLSGVRLFTGFAPAEDYPRLLAAADLGVCMHFSSSGVDLPMKAVDMIGSGLPVLAKFYPAIRELLKDDGNAVLFSDGATMGRRLIETLERFPQAVEGCLQKRNSEAQSCRQASKKQETVALEKLQQSARELFREFGSWESEWRGKALPVMRSVV